MQKPAQFVLAKFVPFGTVSLVLVIDSGRVGGMEEQTAAFDLVACDPRLETT